jgi:hypothetical protein
MRSNHVNNKVLTRWDELIKDANHQIETSQDRIKRLQKALRTLKGLRDSGEPWPEKNAIKANRNS